MTSSGQAESHRKHSHYAKYFIMSDVGTERTCRSGHAYIVTESMREKGRYYCSKCATQRAAVYSKVHPEQHQAWQRAYEKRNYKKKVSRNRAYVERYPEKHRAHQLIKTAIVNGSLARQPCSVCGSTVRIHAHHKDYSKPMEVIWLCHTHHTELHLRTDNQQAAA